MSSLTNELQTAGKAFLEFATVADEFESYQHAHATRIAAIPTIGDHCGPLR
jgi:hypothetical protein